MKQSEAQRIGARANDIFTYQRPQNWIFRSQQDMDFGVDYEIEIFDKKGVSTGLIAKIQLKGSENIKYIDNKTKISFSFPMDNAQYLIEEIQIPSYLIICDNNSEKCYWSSFKTNAQLWHHIATMAIISNALQWHKINLKMHEAEPTEFSDFWIVNVSAKIQQLFVEIANEFNEVQKNIDELINNQDYRFFIELLPEFIFSITGFLFFLNEELEESFTKIENYFDLLTDLAFNLIKNIDLHNKWGRYEYLLKTRIAYKGFYINKDYKKSLEIFKKDVYPVAFQIEDSTLRKDMLIYIKKYIQNIKSSYENNIDEIPIEEEIEIYRANLTAMGVNLDNPSNDTDKAIKEAFEALNPERVLKNCIHLYACQSIVSPLGQWVKLNTLHL